MTAAAAGPVPRPRKEHDPEASALRLNAIAWGKLDGCSITIYSNFRIVVTVGHCGEADAALLAARAFARMHCGQDAVVVKFRPTTAKFALEAKPWRRGAMPSSLQDALGFVQSFVDAAPALGVTMSLDTTTAGSRRGACEVRPTVQDLVCIPKNGVKLRATFVNGKKCTVMLLPWAQRRRVRATLHGPITIDSEARLVAMAVEQAIAARERATREREAREREAREREVREQEALTALAL